MADALHPSPARHQRRPSARLWLVAAVAVALLFVSVVAGWLWFGELGGGETRDSPDGRFEASAFNKSCGTIQGTREGWVEIRVTERGTGREVWMVKRHPPPGTAPDYGMRGVKFVEWAADSTAVSIDVGGGQKMTFPVP